MLLLTVLCVSGLISLPLLYKRKMGLGFTLCTGFLWSSLIGCSPPGHIFY